MRFPGFVIRSPGLVSAVMLMVAVLFSQWVGLHHGIRHAGLQTPSVQAPQIDSEENTSQHSCIAFDAAALTDSISLAPYSAPLLTGARVLALWAAFTSWDAPFTLHFSSRAPPQS